MYGRSPVWEKGDNEVDPDLLFQYVAVAGLSAGELTGIMEYSLQLPFIFIWEIICAMHKE